MYVLRIINLITISINVGYVAALKQDLITSTHKSASFSWLFFRTLDQCVDVLVYFLICLLSFVQQPL